MNTLKEEIIKLYLEYVNNFTTASGLADYYNIDSSTARELINIGKTLYNSASKRELEDIKL